MPTALMSKNEILVKLAQVFRQSGYDGATLTLLSEVTSLSRASLYHYFPDGKKQMAAAALEYINNLFEQSILSPLRSDDIPKERLCQMSTNLKEFYSCGENACLLAVLALGESRDLFHNQIRNAFIVWIDSLVEVLVEAGFDPDCAHCRAEDAILQLQGALVLVRALDDPTLPTDCT